MGRSVIFVWYVSSVFNNLEPDMQSKITTVFQYLILPATAQHAAAAVEVSSRKIRYS